MEIRASGDSGWTSEEEVLEEKIGRWWEERTKYADNYVDDIGSQTIGIPFYCRFCYFFFCLGRPT